MDSGSSRRMQITLQEGVPARAAPGAGHCPLVPFCHSNSTMLSHLLCAAGPMPIRKSVLSSSLRGLVLCLGFPISKMGMLSPTCNGCCKGLNELISMYRFGEELLKQQGNF